MTSSSSRVETILLQLLSLYYFFLLNTRTLFIYVVHPCLRYIPGIRQGFTRERNTSVYITCIMLPRAGSYGLHSLRYRSLNPLTCTTVRVYKSCTTYRKGRVGSRYQSRIVIISDVRHREDHYKIIPGRHYDPFGARFVNPLAYGEIHILRHQSKRAKVQW